MGQGPSESPDPQPGLSAPPPCPYLLVYDAEDPRCRRVADWFRRHDQAGAVVAFPFQNPELARVAPELAGRVLDRGVYGYDPRTGRVLGGSRLLSALLVRLPGWRWLAPLVRLPLASTLFYAWIRRR